MRQKAYIWLLTWAMLSCPWSLGQDRDWEKDWSYDPQCDVTDDEIRVQKWIGQEAKVQELIQRLSDRDTGICAAIELGEIAQDAPQAVVDRIVFAMLKRWEMFGDDFMSQRYFLNLKENAAVAAPTFVQWLADNEKRGLHSLASYMLEAIGEPVEPYLPQLLRIYNRDALRAADALVGKLGPRAMPELIKVLQEKDFGARHFALFVLDDNLDKLGDSIQEAIPYVVYTVRDDIWFDTHLGLPVGLTKVCLPALAELLAHEDEQVRERVEKICINLQHQSIFPLIEALGNSNPRVRAKVSEMLLNSNYLDLNTFVRLLKWEPGATNKRKITIQKILQNKDLPRNLRDYLEDFLFLIEDQEKERRKAK